MKLNLSILLLLCFISGQLRAQLELKPLIRAHHVLKPTDQKLYKKAETDTLNLPFFDDFVYPGPSPDTSKWEGNQVFVNKDFGLNPPSFGVATFDQLDPYGNPWFPFSTFGTGPGDTLTSRHINLKDSAGVPYKLSDSIGLSFFYQSKGLGDLSKDKDTIYLQFKNAVGNWITLWKAAGREMKNFSYVYVPVDQASYLHPGFQFRFHSYTFLWGNNNHFHLDYVMLNKNRKSLENSFDDYAVVSPPTSLLRNYSAMPYAHFSQNPVLHAADSIFFTVGNLSSGILNIEVKHKETHNGNTLIETNYVNNAANVPALGNAIRRFPNFNFSGLTGEKVVIDRVYEMRQPSILNVYKDNDKLSYPFVFDNYYAYDDGTAEAGFGFNDLISEEGSIAVKFDLAKSDTLRAFGVFFNQSVTDVSRVLINLGIWQDLNQTPVYYISNVSPAYTDSLNGYQIYVLDTPVVLAQGAVYAGWEQSGNFNLNVGLDKNNGYISKKSGANTNIYYRIAAGSWVQNTDPSIDGSPMIRLYVGKPYNPVAGISKPDFRLNLYPNPSDDFIQVNLKGEFEIYNYLGQKVQDGHCNELEPIDTKMLQNGHYLIKIKTPENGVYIYKFIHQNHEF